MLPTTKQATSLEVEGNTTVEVTGVNSEGESLKDLQSQDNPENKTADTQGEEPKQVEPEQGETGVSSEGQEVSDKDRHAKRTEKLIDTLKAKTDEVSALRRQLDSMRQIPQSQEPQLPPWLQNPVMEGEVTPEQYQANVADTARNLVKAEISGFQQKVLKYETFKDDLAQVEAKYPILKEGSDVYDPQKSKNIAELYQKASAGDPSLRLIDFVDSIMSFHEAGQSSGRDEVKTSVIKKEAEAAITPTPETGSQSQKSDDWDSMTLKQKEDWMKANHFWD